MCFHCQSTCPAVIKKLVNSSLISFALKLAFLLVVAGTSASAVSVTSERLFPSMILPVNGSIESQYPSGVYDYADRFLSML